MDITMCLQKNCGVRATCLRANKSSGNEYWQSMNEFPGGKKGCDYYLEFKSERAKTRDTRRKPKQNKGEQQ